MNSRALPKYGQVHQDAVEPKQNVLIVDDVIATGGTVEAVVHLVKEMKGNIVGAAFLIELTDLQGRQKIQDIPLFSLIRYQWNALLPSFAGNPRSKADRPGIS